MQDLINFLRKRNVEQADIIIKLTGENKKMASVLNCYPDPNIPGNTKYNDTRGKWRKAQEVEPKRKKTGRRGPPMGHAGVSHHNVPEHTICHHLLRCSRCGGGSFKKGRPVSKMVVDFAGNTIRMVPVMHAQERGT